MTTAHRTAIARLSIGAIDYPLESGVLIRTTHPTGRTEWEVTATARFVYHLDQILTYQLYIVAKDGQSYVGVAQVQNESVQTGVRASHRFIGTGELALGGRMPAP